MSRLVPVIAIHGVGRHFPGVLQERLRAAVAAAGVPNVEVWAFDWDATVSHGRVVWDTVRNLQRVCGSLEGTAEAVLGAHVEGADLRWSRIQVACCYLLGRLIGMVMAVLFGIPAVALALLLPPAFMQITPFWPAEQLSRLLELATAVVVLIAGVLVALILGLGGLRAIRRRSAGPARGATTAVALLVLSPLLTLIGIPVSMAWTTVGLDSSR